MTGKEVSESHFHAFAVQPTSKVGLELGGIQFLRGFAALIVAFHHALEESNGAIGRFSPDWMTTAGAAGVDIFFVISGFIMFYSTFTPGRAVPTAGQFLVKRVIRIYPFYWLCCAAMLSVVAVGFLSSRSFDPLGIVLALALLPNDNPIIGVSWTLVFEMYFYALFALTLLSSASQHRPRHTIIGTTIAIVVLHFAAPAFPEGPLSNVLDHPIVFEFCFGMVLGMLFNSGLLKVGPIYLVPGAALLALAPIFVEHDTTAGLPGFYRVLAWGVPATLMVAAALKLRISPDRKVGRALATLGDASYALYLTHPFVMIAYAAALKRSDKLSELPQLPIVLVIVSITVIVALFAHFAVERPLSVLAKRAVAMRRKPEIGNPA